MLLKQAELNIACLDPRRSETRINRECCLQGLRGDIDAPGIAIVKSQPASDWESSWRCVEEVMR